MCRRVLNCIGAAILTLVGCSSATKVDGPVSSISEKGPDLGSLRHRDRQYDLRKAMVTGTATNDEFLKELNKSAPMARANPMSLDARHQLDAVAVEDQVSNLDRE